MVSGKKHKGRTQGERAHAKRNCLDTFDDPAAILSLRKRRLLIELRPDSEDLQTPRYHSERDVLYPEDKFPKLSFSSRIKSSTVMVQFAMWANCKFATGKSDEGRSNLKPVLLYTRG